MYSHFGDTELDLPDILSQKRRAGTENREMKPSMLSAVMPDMPTATPNSTAPPRRHRAWHCPLLLAVVILLLTRPASTLAADWQSLFDGKTLKGWKITD